MEIIKNYPLFVTQTLMDGKSSLTKLSIMRTAPIGLAFRNASDILLYRASVAQSLTTHYHPESFDSSFILNKMISTLCKMKDTADFIVVDFIKKMRDLCHTKVLREKISFVLESFDKNLSDLEVINNLVTVEKFGGKFHIIAVEALSTVIWFFLKYWNHPEQSMIEGVTYGGDADTIGTCLGALMGALHGYQWIPKRWFNNIQIPPLNVKESDWEFWYIENPSEYSRESLIPFAKNLSKLDLKSYKDIENDD